MKQNWSVTVKGKPQPKSKTLIKLELIFFKHDYNRVPKVLAITGLSQLWNDKVSRFESKKAEYDQLNIDIANEILKYRRKAEEWDEIGKDWTPIELSHCFDQPITKMEKKKSVSDKVSDMIDTVISDFTNKQRVKGGRILTSANNADNYKFLKSSLEKFTKEKYQKDFKQYTFHAIDSKFLEEYVVFVKLEGNKKGNNGALKHKLKSFHSVFNKAKDAGVTGVNLRVFNSVSEYMKGGKSTPRTANYDIIQQILDFDMSTYSPKEQLYRDLFKFTFYAAGMAPVDVCNLTYSQIKGDYIEYERTKCNAWGKPLVIDKMQILMDKYKGECFNDYVFPVFKEKHKTEKQKHERCERIDHKVNDLLKAICKELGIKDKVTWYSARGAFITKMIDSGEKVLVVAEQAGNSPDVISKHYYQTTSKNMESTRARMNVIFG